MSKSHLKHNGPLNKACEDKSVETIAPKETLLFATKTCPNCKMAKAILDKAGVKYTVIDAEENKELTEKFKVRKAPTLLVPNGDGYDVYDNASEVNRYVEGLKKRA